METIFKRYKNYKTIKRILLTNMNNMKNLKNNKKVLVLILSMFLITVTACSHEDKNEVKDSTYKFKQDSSLSKFVTPDIKKDVLESNIGAAPPKLSFANDNYVGILNYNGLLVYSLNDGKLSSAIDINGLGFNQIQGDGALNISSNNGYLVLSKVREKKGYIYSFKDKCLSEIEDISKIKSSKIEYLDLTESKKLKSAIKENNEISDVIKTESGYIVLVPDYDNLKNSCLIKVDQNYNIVVQFKIS